ncbi:MAG TPA: ankyrin repeat domain-containing protein [Pyrinomonadaceae bacterium]|jgi:ankyrin repeat protein|nr:ankyrin repeat domain-containing protein [Pyrinomonadaceae bacterium]
MTEFYRTFAEGMNSYIKAVTDLDIAAVQELLTKDPKWKSWSEPSGKNALHYLCGVRSADDPQRADAALSILKLLLKNGMDINSVHKIEDKICDFFPATPLWYAYTRGRNEKLYKYLLKHGADLSHCWWAIAWYDDIAAAKLWLKHGAKIDKKPSLDDLFLGSFQWKKFAFANWLLYNGADVNAADDRGNTALMLAVKRKDEDSIRLLIGRGADPDKLNNDGLSARMIAETKGPKRLLDIF